MSEQQLNEIADKADMIIANYSFTVTDNGDVKILYLSNPEQACVLNKDGDMIKSSMCDAQLALNIFHSRSPVTICILPWPA